MKVNIITENECFNMDSETGSVVRNTNVKWDLTSRIFYIEQDGALKLPGDGDYVVDFDPNEVKAGDLIFVSYRLNGKTHIILLKNDKFTKLVNLFKEERNKQREEIIASKSASCSDCDEWRDSGEC